MVLIIKKEQVKGKEKKRSEGEEGEGEGKEDKAEMVEVTGEKITRGRGTRRRKRGDLYLVDLQMVSKTDTHANHQRENYDT